jgi:hypothetical protein
MGVAKYNWMRQEVELRVSMKALSFEDRRELLNDLITTLCENLDDQDNKELATAIVGSIGLALLQ